MRDILPVVMINIIWVIMTIAFFNPKIYKQGYTDGYQSRIDYEKGRAL